MVVFWGGHHTPPQTWDAQNKTNNEPANAFVCTCCRCAHNCGFTRETSKIRALWRSGWRSTGQGTQDMGGRAVCRGGAGRTWGPKYAQRRWGSGAVHRVRQASPAAAATKVGASLALALAVVGPGGRQHPRGENPGPLSVREHRLDEQLLITLLTESNPKPSK